MKLIKPILNKKEEEKIIYKFKLIGIILPSPIIIDLRWKKLYQTTRG